MNKDRFIILRSIMDDSSLSQREIAQLANISLGKTNRIMQELIEENVISYSNGEYILHDNVYSTMENYRVDNAIIMAAGFGSRFVPLSYERPKGLLEVHGERMIERQIEQLLEASITDITIAVGYLKEKFDYLVDKYGVKLIYCPDYATKNNLSTLYHCRDLLKNTYILSSDNYMTKNLFNEYEYYSWYTAVQAEGETDEWCLGFDKKERIDRIEIGGRDEWHMYGPVYFSRDFSKKIVPLIEENYHSPGTSDFYWEHVLRDNLDILDMYVNRQPNGIIYEFENLEELREFDPSYINNSKSLIMEQISSLFKIEEKEINSLRPLKLGMTNKSFIFGIKDKEYICRIPGEGTDKLINRRQEYISYQAVTPLNITENVVFMDPNKGIKITEYEKDARTVDFKNQAELSKAVGILRRLHTSGIEVSHSFNLESLILLYEGLCQEHGAINFEDYIQVKIKMNELLSILKAMDCPQTFSHIDPVADNFLVLSDGSLRLIDWEYSGMCDPLIDLSMLALYSYFNEAEVENLMETYFGRTPQAEERLRVYAYMALGGFLWALWAEYKQALGVTFGDYTLKMYRYAKDYYKKSMAIVKGGE